MNLFEQLEEHLNNGCLTNKEYKRATHALQELDTKLELRDRQVVSLCQYLLRHTGNTIELDDGTILHTRELRDEICCENS